MSPTSVIRRVRDSGHWIANLAARPFPAALYEEPRWYACYTHPRHEKQVDSLFRRRGIESLLLLVPRVRQWHDRKKVVLFPLFPSYVFARFALDSLGAVLGTPGVATVVRINGCPAPITDEEIENVTRFAAVLEKTGLDPQRQTFEAGQPVRIVSGPFVGITGVVLEVRGRKRVLVGLSTIGVGFDVDVPVSAVEPIRGGGKFVGA